jgi:hypothetical protein
VTRRIIRAAAGASAAFLVAAAVAVAVPTAAFGAVTRTVTDPADTDTAGTLRYELTHAGAGDTIVFGGPVFTDDSPDIISLGSSIDIPVGVIIDGPGPGMLSIVRGAAGDYFLLGLRPTVPDQDYVVEGLTLDGTTGTGSAMYASFNGMMGNNNTARDITITDVIATNFTSTLGGVLATYSTKGSILIEGSTFSSNDATLGGAVSIESPGGSVTLQGSTISANTATTGGAHGGGVYLDNVPGAITINDVDFLMNDAAQGGGLYVNQLRSAATIAGSTFSENGANDGGTNTVAAGGGVYIATTSDLAASLTVNGSRFTENDATDASVGFGAGLYVNGIPALTVRSTTFDGQTFDGEAGIGLSIGGAVHVRGFIENSTFDETGLTNHYAIYLSGLASLNVTPDIDIEHSTVVGPGALYVENNQSDVDITHSILDGLGVVAAHSDSGAAMGVNWSIVSSPLDADLSDDGHNRFSTDALLAPLADNGNNTFSRLPGALSPAREGGDPAIVGAPLLDQRGAGFPRILGVIDIGALEQGPATGPQLAATGSDHVRPTLVAVLFALLAGLALLAVERRRRSA